MYKSRSKLKDPKRPSTFLSDLKSTWTSFRNASEKVITATHSAFRYRAEFADRLTKSGGNSDLIEYLTKEVATNTFLRERFLKGIADDLPMKHDSDAWSEFLRDEEKDMDEKGKGNEFNDQVPDAFASARRKQYQSRRRGQAAYAGRGRGDFYPLQGGVQRGHSLPYEAGARCERGRRMPIPAWQQVTGRPHFNLRRPDEEAEVAENFAARMRKAAVTEAEETAEAVAAPRESPAYDASQQRKR